MQNQTVFISGSSRGIGRATALQLAKDGYNVVLHGKTMSKALEQTLNEVKALGVHARALTFDITDRELTQKILLDDIQTHGMYWGLVINAGITDDGTFAGMLPESWDRVIKTNLDSFYNIVQPLIMPLVRTLTLPEIG